MPGTIFVFVVMVLCGASGAAVKFSIDDASGEFGAAPGGFDVELRGLGFSAEVDGAALARTPEKSAAVQFRDELGSGKQVTQRWGGAIAAERIVHVYDDLPAIVVRARIINKSDRPVAVGTVKLIDCAKAGAWRVGKSARSPGAVYVSGNAMLACDVAGAPGAPKKYDATQVLALAEEARGPTLVVGYLTAQTARPEIAASFAGNEQGNALTAQLRLLGRVIAPGETLELDRVYLAAGSDVFAALETYAKAAANCAKSVRTGPTALWCSWYAHRMDVSEDLVLANAAVAAKHFAPLGFQIMQIDHGWQRGDVTGDWVPNERFKHGLKWLSDELQKRHGLKLGLWIAPTDVAETSETFAKHREWMLGDGNGQPAVNWRWYWKPNPNCFELDASQPAAAKWVEDVFARLTAQGVSYYKIDFVAASGDERFVPAQGSARGWGVLRSAMTAIRRGAGEAAWIRYCQTPPLLSAGLANSAYAGEDTLDAGIPQSINSLRNNARSLAAGYFLNDALYHREVCDMSVRMQAEVEEARLRLAMMSLAGCSISFSDELRYLPPSRIRMMQQVLPPGAPPMRPVDLLQRAIPSVWHLHCQSAGDVWETVGLFNWEDETQERSVDFSAIGLEGDAEVAAFEFWEERFLGVLRKKLSMTLPGRSCRIVSLRRKVDRPQVVGSDMHVLEGVHEIKELNWDEKALTLSGRCRRMPGVAGKVYVYVPKGYRPHFDFPLREGSARLTHVQPNLWAVEIEFAKAEASFSARFERE